MMKDIIQTLKHRDGRSILWGYFAAEGNGSLHKTDHIMRKQKYRNMLKQLQPEILDLSCKWVFQIGNDTKSISKVMSKWFKYKSAVVIMKL